jgi:hypothetical protein
LAGASNYSLDPAQRAEARDEWDIVVKAINTLTEEQRQVLLGRLILGYDVASCAYTWEKCQRCQSIAISCAAELATRTWETAFP